MKPTTLSREEVAKLEIGQTEIAGWLARAITVTFLAVIFAAPLVHELVERKPQDDRAAQTWPRCCAIFTTLPDVAMAFDRADGNLWQRTLAANRRLLKNIDLYESGLKEESLLVRGLLGPTQHALTKWGGLGNEKAYLGRDGWLFYRPSVDYVIGPGFLDPRALAKRAQAGKNYVAPPQPDPRTAIVEFAHQLRRRGIALIVVPAPGKPTIHPERLSTRYSIGDDALHNESFARFKQDIEREGVIVFDPAPLLHARKQQTGDAQFLKTDTHWAPSAAEAVAEALRRLIEERAPLPERLPAECQARRQKVRGVGDIAAMLRLPEDQTLFLSEAVEIRQIADREGALWQPDATADVLLLGDSFTNIYSQPAMHWGESAGLAEQLSYAMRRPLDRISQNDAGAYATRRALAQELARGDDRLAGKRLVIWEFAARELAVGDWKLLPLPSGERDSWGDLPGSPEQSVKPRAAPLAKDGRGRPPHGEKTVVVRGRIEATAGVPQPGSVPYRDAVTSLHLSVIEPIEGDAPTGQIVVYILGMRNNRWTAAARYKPGDIVTLRLQPWSEVSAKHGSLTRIELDDPDFTLVELPLFWGEENLALGSD